MNRDGSNLTQITELDAWDSWPIWGENNIYFLSGRAKNSKEFIQRIWKLNLL
jgi:Tol biopolymer transport system component